MGHTLGRVLVYLVVESEPRKGGSLVWYVPGNTVKLRGPPKGRCHSLLLETAGGRKSVRHDRASTAREVDDPQPSPTASRLRMQLTD